MILNVAVPVPVDKIFSYLPPENAPSEIDFTGRRVKVPFGKRTLTGYVLSVRKVENSEIELKRAYEIIDSSPLINDETMELAGYVRKNYVCSLGEALSSIIPVSMKPSKRRKSVSDSGCAENRGDIFPFALTSRQQNAVNLVNKSIENEISQTFLIRGVTASGKTEVYLRCMEKSLSLGKSAIMLIPEISLTPQFVEIVKRRFGSCVGVWHSGISATEKYRLFSAAKSGEIKVMLGARSAVFAPFEKIGIIIIDEEHEHTYKQEQKPSYDAREIAAWRSKYHKASLALGSATPSLESFKDALENKTSMIEMPERVDNKALPEIKVLSLRNKYYGAGMLLNETIEAVSRALANKEQVIVFLNRRGYSPSIMCRKCGRVYQCPNCSISMAYHRKPDVLKCHYCGYEKKLPISCPQCKSGEIAVFGAGTQKVEDELKKLFPKASVLRLDSDTASSSKAYENAYQGLKNLDYDILIGTQMIAKGFDFPNVSLVCVIDADTSLYLPDFKSAERTFQIITQVAGRCGRGKSAGNVIVQTNYPGHYAIECAKKHDFESFYKEETKQREKLFYPPYCDIAKIAVKNKNEEKAAEDCDKLFKFLDGYLKSASIALKLLGPAAAYIPKLHNTYRRHIIVKGFKDDILGLASFASGYSKKFQDTKISVEIMPSDLI